MNRIFQWSRNSLLAEPTVFIFIGLVLYSFTTSCPHNIGLLQVLIAICLVAAVITGKTQFIWMSITPSNTDVYPKVGGWAQLAVILLFVIATLAVFIRLDSKFSLWILGRDVLPYFFLILPLLFTGISRKTAVELTRVIPILMTLIGVVYSLKFILAVLDQSGSVSLFLMDQINSYSCQCIKFRVSRDDYCYPFDPAVQFSAIFLALQSVKKMASGNASSVAQGFILILLSAIPLVALSLLLNRAMLGLACVALILFCLGSWRRVIATFVFVTTLIATVFLAVTLIIVTPSGSASTAVPSTAVPSGELLKDALMEKQRMLGSNNKIREFVSVYQELSAKPLNIIFGLGWGGQFYSPAVGQVVSFTHSLISYILLKAGVVGVCLLSGYLFWIIFTYFRIEKRTRHVLAPELYAINCVVLIALFLQPTYKTPTFGVLLLFILAAYVSTSKDVTQEENMKEFSE